MKNYAQIRTYLKSLKNFPVNFTTIVLLSTLASGLGLLYPKLFLRMIEKFQSSDVEGFAVAVAIVVGLQIFQNLIMSVVGFLRRRFDLFANRPVIMDFYEKVQSLPLSAFRRYMNTGEIYQRVIDALELNRVVADVITQLFALSVRLLVLVGVIAYFDLLTGILVLSMLAVFYTINRIVSPRAQRYQSATLLSNSPLTNALFEGLNKITTIKALGAKDHVLRDVSSKLDDNIGAQLRFVVFSTKVTVSTSLITQLLRGAMICFVGVGAIQGRIELHVALGLIFLVQQAFEPMQGFVDIFVDLNRAIIILQRYFGVLNEASEEEGEGRTKIALDRPCRIDLENVGFGYGGDKILDAFSLVVPAGARVALVGRSGAGKSTIMNLILGLYRPGEGAVKVNGQDLSTVDLTSYRKQIGVVLQNEYIFNGTIRENITFGLERTPTAGEIDEAVRCAQLTPLVESRVGGLDEILQEDSLSGGERQRLILARAFLRNPRFLVLDEPTSALDMETEGAIQQAMDLLLENRTSLTIAHRLSTIMKSDLIYVLDDGCVVESGTHDQLLANNGYYSQLYRQSFVA
ncbi:MAG: ABC transporter ATP-binding protein [Pseudomonadota bacterium]